jgi:hypothetical protein
LLPCCPATEPRLGAQLPTLEPSTAPIILQNAVIVRALLPPPRLDNMPLRPGQEYPWNAAKLDELIRTWLETYFQQQRGLTKRFKNGGAKEQQDVEDAMPPDLVWLLFHLLQQTAVELQEVSSTPCNLALHAWHELRLPKSDSMLCEGLLRNMLP